MLSLAVPVAVATGGDPMRHRDRAHALYRVVVNVDGSDHPVLPVAVLERTTLVTIEASHGLRVLGTGDGAVEVLVPAGRAIEVRGDAMQPGQILHYVALARAPSGDMDALRAARKFWQEKGLAVKPLTVGATYAVSGRVLDTRETVLGLEPPFPDAAAAERKAQQLGDLHGRDTAVHAVVQAPPSATLRVDAPGGVSMRAQDVLWFEALPAQPASAGAGKQPGPAAAAGAEVAVLTVSAGGTRLELPGRVYVTPGDGGGLAVVNEARIETILEGVVASEIFQSAPMDALKAQAIAARTDMLAKVGLRHHADPFAICSEVHCQAYRGTARVPARVAEAVRATRGEVLFSSDGRLVDTFYHAVSGGHTEHNENAWRMAPHPNLRGRPDLVAGAANPLAVAGAPPSTASQGTTAGASEDAVLRLLDGPDKSWASASGRNKNACRWEVTYSAAEVEAALGQAGLVGKLKGLRVLERGVSGRIVHLELTFADGSQRKIWGELRIRRLFKGLRSSLVVITPGAPGAGGLPSAWTFRGAGYGHGVGMDQTGAVGRAEKGQRYQEILSHYYGGAKVERLY